jgi:TRAP-type uncharacterized transport system substrate-binding protein
MAMKKGYRRHERIVQTLAVAAVLLLLGGCQKREVVYAKGGGVGRGATVIEFFKPAADALRKKGIRLRVDTTTSGSGQALAAVAQGTADLTTVPATVLLTNAIDTISFALSTVLRTLAPSESQFLHLLCHKDLPQIPFGDLVRGRSIWCGQVGSATHRTALAMLEHLGVPPNAYQIVGENRALNEKDSIIFNSETFNGLKKKFTLLENHELCSLEDTNGTSLAEGFAKSWLVVKANTLPAYTLGPRQPKPVIYLWAQEWYVCRADVPDAVAYELARALNPKPSGNGLTLEEVDLATLPFPLHEGARQYRDRDRPSFVQRNAESLGLLFTIGGLLAAGGTALLAQRRRRNSRIFEGLYARVAELELACAEASSGETSEALAKEVKSIQRQLLQDMSRHSELTEARTILLQQKLSSCLQLLTTLTAGRA